MLRNLPKSSIQLEPTKKNRKETLKNVSNNKKTKIKHGKFRCETYHYHFPMIPDLETYKKRKVKETLGRFLIKKKTKKISFVKRNLHFPFQNLGALEPTKKKVKRNVRTFLN